MRTNIVIDDELMSKVLKKGKFKSKKDAVEYGLRLILLLDEQKKIKQYRGQLKWEGDLEKSRTSV
jgi:Arc/MetJ family transcription regulator